MADNLTNIAVFGASGNLGCATVTALLETGKHNVRAITRLETDAEFLPGVEVVKGDLTSGEFLARSLQNQDALIIALNLAAPPDVDRMIVTAAAEAGVRYIFPNEFTSQDSLRKDFPFNVHEKKNEIRALIESLGRSKWISIVNGTWYDYSLEAGAYGIDLQKRQATIWTPGNIKANVTTLATVGKSVAALLSLPPREIENFTNQCVYVSSFRVSQLDILHSVQRATGTQDCDWKISYENATDALQDAQESASKGNVDGFMKTIYIMQFLPNGAGDYEAIHGTSNEALGLGHEDFDAATHAIAAKLVNH